MIGMIEVSMLLRKNEIVERRNSYRLNDQSLHMYLDFVQFPETTMHSDKMNNAFSIVICKVSNSN
jgi:hypothetical protein